MSTLQRRRYWIYRIKFHFFSNGSVKSPLKSYSTVIVKVLIVQVVFKVMSYNLLYLKGSINNASYEPNHILCVVVYDILRTLYKRIIVLIKI